MGRKYEERHVAVRVWMYVYAGMYVTGSLLPLPKVLKLKIEFQHNVFYTSHFWHEKRSQGGIVPD